MKKYSHILLSILLISCSSNNKISVLNDSFINSIGIYFLNNDTINKVIYDKITKDKFPDFKRFDTIPDSSNIDLYSITIEKPSKKFTPPNINSLSYFGRGLSDEEKSSLQNYKNIVSIVFRGLSKDVYNKQKRINEFVNELIKDKKVIVADLNSYEWFNAKSWNEKRVDNFSDSIKDITHQISVHVYRTGEFCRAVTMGMDKFCLPDISIKDFSCSHQNTYDNLISAVIQTLAENPFISEDSTLLIDLKALKNDVIRKILRANLKQNAKENALIKFKSVEPEEGDNFNKQFLVSFENSKFTTPQEEQENLVTNLFGTEDSVIYINHDSLILKTSEKARQRLPELRTLFNNGLAPGYSILVKAPFKTENGGNEWMWVEITKWTLESITGILQNEPYEIKNLTAGAIVIVNEKDIFDYILNKPDGSSEGNETGKIIDEKK